MRRQREVADTGAAARPSAKEFNDELKRVRHSREYGHTLRTTIYILLTVAAIAVLIATLLLPVLQVTGTSMEPVLESGQIVVALKNAEFRRGDVIAFYYNNKVLLKRVIGLPGDRVSIDLDGNVSVNGYVLDEPYLTDKSIGNYDLDFPYQVPDGKYFVLGDHRESSQDSRLSAIGSIADEYIIGKIAFRVWPLKDFGGSGIDYQLKVGES